MQRPAVSFFSMKTDEMTYYTLTRADILAIATRAAELAIEQAFAGNVPTFRRPSYMLQSDPDARQLTTAERQAVAAIFE